MTRRPLTSLRRLPRRSAPSRAGYRAGRRFMWQAHGSRIPAEIRPVRTWSSANRKRIRPANIPPGESAHDYVFPDRLSPERPRIIARTRSMSVRLCRRATSHPAPSTTRPPDSARCLLRTDGPNCQCLPPFPAPATCKIDRRRESAVFRELLKRQSNDICRNDYDVALRGRAEPDQNADSRPRPI